MNNLTQTQKWVDTKLYPFKRNYVDLSSGRMHYIDEGEGEVILFVHGTPTWSFLYRDFIKEFSKTNRCIAIDHMGFGLSEKPEFFDGTPQSHSRNLIAFIEKLGISNITLVVHDFGGPIGLSAAIALPEKFTKIVMFNTWLWETESNKEVRKIDKILNGWMGRFMYLNMNFSPKVLLKKAFADKSKLTREIHEHYIKPFHNRASRLSLLHIAQSLKGSSNWYEEQKGKLSAISGKPWLILWGTKDNFISMNYLDKWKHLVPSAIVKELNTGHFVQEEKPLESIIEIVNFLKLDKLLSADEIKSVMQR